MDYDFFQAFLSQGIFFMRVNFLSLGVIVETKGVASGRCKKGHFFTTKTKKKVKKGTPNLTSTYGASLYFFLKKKKSHHQGQHPEVGLS